MPNTENAAAIAAHIRKETRKNFVLNFLFNAVIAYAILRGVSALSTWGEHGYGKDLILTGFLLSAILSGIFIAVTRHKCSKGELIPQGDEGRNLAWLIPYNPWLASFWLGILGAVIAAPLLLGLLTVLGVETLSPIAYALIKGTWGGVLAAIVVPVAILQGLRNRSPGAAPS